MLIGSNMPHFEYADSLPDYSHSPQSDLYGYMDGSEQCIYEHTFVDVFTGGSSHHMTLSDGGGGYDLYPSPNDGNSTASKKAFAFHTDMDLERQHDWTHKPLRHWRADDIMSWIVSVADHYGYEYENIHMEAFNVDGLALLSMTETQFVAKSPEFGKTLFLSLQGITGGYTCDRISPLPTFDGSFRSEYNKTPMLPTKEDTRSLTDLNVERTAHHDGLAALVPSDSEPTPAPLVPQKRLPGRPRGTRTKKKPEKRCGRLWEFIRDLLLNREYCPSLICWDDHDNGVFRFVHSEKVAKLWGTIKENPKMTYEKLSRAMRYYYKSKVLQPVLGRRLVYKFGPTATGWRTPNPNFRLCD